MTEIQWIQKLEGRKEGGRVDIKKLGEREHKELGFVDVKCISGRNEA